MKKKLTIGMAVYNDVDGVWNTIQHIRMGLDSEVRKDVEFIVIDNSPESNHGIKTAEFVNNWVREGRHVPYSGVTGTAAPRNKVFELASADYVLCIDSHVLLEKDSVEKLIKWYELFPKTQDLFQGPMHYDGLDGQFATHMKEEWRDGMYGTWGFDPRGVDNDGDPFEIRMHGLGLFSCRKDAWLGFNEDFRAFGGEEGYIHEKYRTHGRKVICLPFLKWLHKFFRADPPKYPICNTSKLRNYIIGWNELGMNLDDPIKHFENLVQKPEVNGLLRELKIDYKLKD